MRRNRAYAQEKTCGGADCNEAKPDWVLQGKERRLLWPARKPERPSKLRDGCLNGEIFYSLREAQVVIEKWRVNYDTKRPRSSLSYRPPAPTTISQNPSPRREVKHAIMSHIVLYKISAGHARLRSVTMAPICAPRSTCGMACLQGICQCRK